MAAVPSAGPLHHATMIVRSFAPLLQAYRALDLHPVVAPASVPASVPVSASVPAPVPVPVSAPVPLTVSVAQAQAWGHRDLAGCRQLMLAPAGIQTPLLRLIEHPHASARPTRYSHGWLALEILVRDVDQLANTLAAHPGCFDIVGPPADLDVSPAIRAMQVIGPAGEMLYLTQIKALVPPFQIPLSADLPGHAALGPMFIAVLSTPSRSATLAQCAALGCQQTLQFDTKITVLNRALGHGMGRRWPVATAQFLGQSLFEIDEVMDPAVGAAPLSVGMLPAGLAWVTMRVPGAKGPALFEVSPGAWVEPVST